MLQKASEILEKFIEIETEELRKIDMPHMPTLGSAYEEITKQAIDQQYIIPKGLDLKVVSGFIAIGDELLPQQIDGMLVHGVGKQYGRTDNFIYQIDQVLCIFEIKKTLNKSDYVDAFDHLRVIRSKYSESFESKFEDPSFEPDISIAQKHFSQITGRNPPDVYSGIHDLSKADGILFYALVQESLAPSSIIHAYGGYTTEAGMRNAFLDILSEKGEVSGKGLGVPSLPTLVTTNNVSIVKGNGMPFIGINKNRQWAALVSMRDNAARIMLEIIWSKISVYFNIKMPWGDDSHVENLAPLLYAVPVEKDDGAGWFYKSVEMKESELRGREFLQEWEPERIDKALMSVFNVMLFHGGYIHLDDIAEVAGSYNETPDKLIDKIMTLFLFKIVGDYIRPISSVMFMITDENGDGYLTSNNENLDVWCKKKGLENNYVTLLIMD